MSVRSVNRPSLPVPPSKSEPVAGAARSGGVGGSGGASSMAESGFDPAAVPTVPRANEVVLPSLDVGDARPAQVGPFVPGRDAEGHTGKPVSVRVEPNLPIEDRTVVTSTVELEGDYDVDTLALELDLKHTYRGDLVVKLTSPSGKTVTVSDRQGGSADDLTGKFDLSAFKGERLKGTWTLSVEDTANVDTGVLRAWGLNIETSSEPAPGTSFEIPVKGLGAIKDQYTAEVHGRDGIVYTTTWGNRGKTGNQIHVWDSSGAEPKLLTSLTVSGAGTIGDVQVSEDGKTLLACADTGFIVTYDLTDPRNPRELARFSSPDTKPEVHTAEIATVNGKQYGFLSSIYHRPPTLVVVDLSDPAKPKQVLALETGSPYLHDVWVKDGVLYTAGWDEGMTLWDIGGAGKGGTPEAPVELSNVKTPRGNVHNIASYVDPVSGKHFAFIGEEQPGNIGKSSAGDIHVVDITDPTQPKHVAFFHVDGAGTHNFALDAENGILYVAYYNGGVRALDIRGDLSLLEPKAADGRVDLGKAGREIGHALDQGGHYVWGVHLVDGMLYASDMLNGVYKLDPHELVPHEH